jgi:hypothetical protein
MPISSTIDYIPVMDEFIAHWNATDPALIIAENGNALTLGEFETLRTDLDDAKNVLQGVLNDLESSRVVLEQDRTNAGDRIAEFNRRIRADFPASSIFNKLPDVPNRAGGRDAFMDPMDDVLNLWAKANALPATPLFTAPLLLPGGFTRANFLALRSKLDGSFTNRGVAERAADDQRLLRNNYQVRAKALMVTYRLKVEALYAPGSNQVTTLPRLTPLPGSTPDAVVLESVWSEPNLRAELTWTESTDPALAGYHVRATPGPDYSAEDETLLATIPPGAPRSYNTAAGLAVPGSAMSYKVYVLLTTGHEAGSNAETVTRPA